MSTDPGRRIVLQLEDSSIISVNNSTAVVVRLGAQRVGSGWLANNPLLN